jgi:adenosylcobinamide-GDP ribazoletransferase
MPVLPDAAFKNSARAVWAYPLAGLLVSGISGLLALCLLALGTSPGIAAGGFLAISLVLTGAMHEDGLADSADGLWGGWTVARRLEIMMDSSIGTYGVLALLMVTGLRWMTVATLLPLGLGPVIAAAMLSRSMIPALMYCLPNARSSGLSHSVGRPPASSVLLGLLIAAAAGCIATGVDVMLLAAPALLATLCTGLVARARIGGQTGDILGACQQLAELFALMALSTLLAA